MLFVVNIEVALSSNPVDGDILGKITDRYKALGMLWGQNIKATAFWLLKTVLMIQLMFWAIKIGFKQATLHDFIGGLIWMVIFGTVFFTLIVYSQQLINYLITGFLSLGANVSGLTFTNPFAIFTNSLTVASAVGGFSSVIRPGVALAAAICMIVILLCGAMIYGIYLLALCEAWIVLNLGIVLLGFGGMDKTRAYAVNFLLYALGVGLRLMTIKLLITVLGTFLVDMATWEFNSLQDVLAITASFIILLFLIKTLPDALSKMVTQNSGSSAGAMTGAMAAGVGAAASAASMGVGAAAGGAAGGIGGALSGARGGGLNALADAANAHLKK